MEVKSMRILHEQWSSICIRLMDNAGMSLTNAVNLVSDINDFKNSGISELELRAEVLLQIHIRDPYRLIYKSKQLTF